MRRVAGFAPPTFLRTPTIASFPGMFRTSTPLYSLLVFVIIFASRPQGTISLDTGGTVHTVFLTECSEYFIFQSMGVIYSHKKSGQPGPLTRVMCCTDEQLKDVSQEELNLVQTHVAPSYSVHPVTGDKYNAYNKPLGMIDWLQKAEVKEEYLLVLDGDMVLRRPFLPEQMGASRGLAVSAFYGYLKGVNNALADKHIPDIPRRNDTRGGIYGRRADQVGGFFFMHKEDMQRLAPLWLKYTEDVRADPDAWNLTGDVYSTTPGSKPWISEMYGYVFAAAKSNVWHITDDTAMIYPEYLPMDVPKILHYGLRYTINGTGYSFDKHLHTNFDPLVCPPWDFSGKRPEHGLFPHPPHPRDLPEYADVREKYAHLLSIETVNTVNEAFCERHLKACHPVSEQLVLECGKVRSIAFALEEKLQWVETKLGTCEDQIDETKCGEWKMGGECERNPSFMHGSCKKTCGRCSASTSMGRRPVFDLNITASDRARFSNGQGYIINAYGDKDAVRKPVSRPGHVHDHTRMKPLPVKPEERSNDGVNDSWLRCARLKLTTVELKECLERADQGVEDLPQKQHSVERPKGIDKPDSEEHCTQMGGLTMQEVEECLEKARKGLRHSKDTEKKRAPDEEFANIVRMDSHTREGSGVGRITRVDTLHERNKLLNNQSLLILEVWVWGLLVVGFLTLLRARTKSNRNRWRSLE